MCGAWGFALLVESDLASETLTTHPPQRCIHDKCHEVGLGLMRPFPQPSPTCAHVASTQYSRVSTLPSSSFPVSHHRESEQPTRSQGWERVPVPCTECTECPVPVDLTYRKLAATRHHTSGRARLGPTTGVARHTKSSWLVPASSTYRILNEECFGTDYTVQCQNVYIIVLGKMYIRHPCSIDKGRPRSLG